MTYLKMLGGGSEIGRSSIMLESRKKLILDHGVKIQPEPPTYPAREKADAAIIAHAHLDHIGAAPLLKMPVYMNDITL